MAKNPRDESPDTADYVFARESAVPNAGEDLLQSARHRRNGWTGLEAAEKDGTAEQMVRRDVLLKTEPPDILAGVTPENAMPSLAAHYCMLAFPPDPGTKKWRVKTSPEDVRSRYLDAYRALKGECEKAALEEKNIKGVLARVNALAKSLVEENRKVSVHYADPVANALVGLYNATRVSSYGRPSKTSVVGKLLAFVALSKAAYQSDHPPPDKAAEHVRDVIEGESLNKTFGAKKSGPKQYNPSDAYVKEAVREGGPVIDASTIQAGLRYMTDVAGMRGVQWGNSVTDRERQHHLQKSAEAMADLTDILGLPPEVASLGGTLGLAIGARGVGSAMAHYEPGTKVINLTRKNGVGSLAHEWGHALDHLLAGGGLKYRTDGRQVGDYLSARWKPAGTSPAVESSMQAVKETFHSTGFVKRLRNTMTELRREGFVLKKGYWDSPEEMFARCFERHVQRKLQKAGRKNTYLAGLGDGGGLWPTDEETDAMAPAFDALIEAFKGSTG